MTDMSERILVVDDEVNVRILYSRVLEKEGYKVDCAASGGEALEKLASQSFDLVVTDLKMNGVDGLEVVKQGKAVNRKVPFILISGYGTAQTAVAAAQEGADIFLMKPIDIAALKTAVKQALGKRHS